MFRILILFEIGNNSSQINSLRIKFLLLIPTSKFKLIDNIVWYRIIKRKKIKAAKFNQCAVIAFVKNSLFPVSVVNSCSIEAQDAANPNRNINLYCGYLLLSMFYYCCWIRIASEIFRTKPSPSFSMTEISLSLFITTLRLEKNSQLTFCVFFRKESTFSFLMYP